MTVIKQYRMEENQVGVTTHVKFFTQAGESVEGALPAEILVRTVSYPANDLNKADVLVNRFKQRLEMNGFKKA